MEPPWAAILIIAIGSMLLILLLAWIRRRRATWDPLLGGNAVMPPPARPKVDFSAYTVSAVPLRRRPRRNPQLLTSGSPVDFIEQRPVAASGPVPVPVFYPEYVIDPMGAGVLGRIIAMGPELRQALRGLPVELEMPLRPRLDGAGELVDADMPELDERFVEGEGELAWERTLDQARELEPEQRLALVVGIGHFLHHLHQRQWAFGALNWSNLLLSSGPARAVLIRGIEQARPLGGTQAVWCKTHPMWRTAFDEPMPTLDLDRYQYALLLYRLLVGSGAGDPLPASVGLAGTPLDRQDLAPRIETLFARAAGAVGTRPSIGEWLAVLG